MRLLAPVIALVMLASCATTAHDPFAKGSDGPTWPPAPEQARLQYVTSIHGPRDLFRNRSLWSSLVRLTVGEEEVRMTRPFAIAIHPDGGIIVTDTGAGMVHYYDLARQKHRALGDRVEGGLTSPVGVAVLGDGTILVSDSRRRSIERLDTEGRHRETFAPDITFERPSGIAVHPRTGEVFVADVLRHRIVVLSSEGHFRREIGSNGILPGEFNFPTQVAIDANGDLLVSDTMNFRIQRLTPEGDPLGVFGEVGNARGNFARPKGVVGIDVDVYAAMEGLYDSMIFFNDNGDLLMSVGTAGSGPGEFWLPSGLAIDRLRGLIFVADSYNGRVQVFRVSSPHEVPTP